MAEISSLGIGSGVLTSDVIDQLRANDETNTLGPIDRNIEINNAKTKDLATLESLMTTFKASASSLGSDLLYQGRTVSTVGDAATVEVLDGVSVQSFDLEISQLAEQDIVQSGSFSKSDALFANNTGTMSIAVGGKSYDIDYKANETLEDLVQNINDKLDGKVTAKVMQVGDEDYRLILSSDETGASNKIILTDGSGNLKDSLAPFDATMIAPAKVANNASGSPVTINASDITLNGINLNSDITIPTGASSSTISKLFKDAINSISDQTGISANVVTKNGAEYLYLTNVDGSLVDENITLTVAGDVTAYSGLTDNTVTHNVNAQTTTIQDAANSEFKFNGISMSRSTNKIEDINVGMTINLLSADATTPEKVNVNITQNVEDIKTEMDNFVSSYNEAMKQISAMTTKNENDNTKGLFSGDSTINGITRGLNNLITSFDSSGISLIDFGIDINRSGFMSLDKETFNTKYNEDPSAAEKLFVGGTYTSINGRESTVDGTFAKVNSFVADMFKSSGSITGTTNGLTSALTQLEDERLTSKNTLDSRYETMIARFVAYDSIISQINASFSTLSYAIADAQN